MWLQASNQAGSVHPPFLEVILLALSGVSAGITTAYRATDYQVGHGFGAITFSADMNLDLLH